MQQLIGPFRSGLMVKRLRLADGQLLRVDKVPLVSLGHVEFMMVVMHPGPNGNHPWVRVVPGEKGFEEYYVNLATVQEVEFSDDDN